MWVVNDFYIFFTIDIFSRCWLQPQAQECVPTCSQVSGPAKLLRRDRKISRRSRSARWLAFRAWNGLLIMESRKQEQELEQERSLLRADWASCCWLIWMHLLSGKHHGRFSGFGIQSSLPVSSTHFSLCGLMSRTMDALTVMTTKSQLTKAVCVFSQLKVFVKAMLRDYHGALSHLDMVRFLMPARFFYWQERGVVKRLMGGLPGALDDLNSRVARNSLSCDSFKHRACLKFRLEDTNGASADAELAMKVAFSSQSTTKAQTSRSIFPLVHVVDCLGMLPVQFLDFTLTWRLTNKAIMHHSRT